MKDGEKMHIKSKISLIDAIIAIYIFAAVVTVEGSIVMKLMRVVLFSTALVLTIRNKKIIFDGYVKWLIIFVLLSLCSVNWAMNKSIAFDMSKTLFLNLLCMYSISYLISLKAERLLLILNCFVVFPLILEIQVIIKGGVFAFLHSRDAGGINGNTVGICAAFGACFALWFYFEKRRKMHLFLCLINIVITVLSSSRKSIVCFVIPLLFMAFYQKNKDVLKKLLKFATVLILVVIGIVLLFKVPILYNTVGNRIEPLLLSILGTESTMDASATTRLNLINWGIEWFKQKMLLGYGIDNYRIVLHYFHSDYPLAFYAHNNYVELLVDLGIVGIITYYFIYVKCLYFSIKKRTILSRIQMLFVGVVISLLISEYGLVSYYDKYTQIILLLSWIVIVKRQDSKSNNLESVVNRYV